MRDLSLAVLHVSGQHDEMTPHDFTTESVVRDRDYREFCSCVLRQT